jgi:hypothetical protein
MTRSSAAAEAAAGHCSQNKVHIYLRRKKKYIRQGDKVTKLVVQYCTFFLKAALRRIAQPSRAQ